MYQPFIFKLENGSSDVLANKPKKEDVILSSTINLPLNSLGFQTFLHRTKAAMNIKADSNLYPPTQKVSDTTLFSIISVIIP